MTAATYTTIFPIVLTAIVTAVFAFLLERVKTAMAHDLSTQIELLKGELTASAEMRRLVAAKRLETAIAIHDKALPFLQWTKGAIFMATDQGVLDSLTSLVDLSDYIHARAFVFNEGTEKSMLDCASRIYDAAFKAKTQSLAAEVAIRDATSAFEQLRSLIRRELLVSVAQASKLSTAVE